MRHQRRPSPRQFAIEMNEELSLEDALSACGLSLPDRQREIIHSYCELLWDWNSRLNLTRHTDFETFVARDVVDSMQLADCLEPRESVMDVGSGGGVPGILLSILRPDTRITLCESVKKKAATLSDIVMRLELPCDVAAARAEEALVDMQFDTLVARAVGPMARMLRWFQPHWSSIGRLLMVKGPRWVEERKEARHLGLLRSLELRRLRSYPMPGTESESVILVLKKSADHSA